MADDVDDSSTDFYSVTPAPPENTIGEQKRKRRVGSDPPSKRRRLHDAPIVKTAGEATFPELQAPIPRAPLRANFATEEKIKAARRDCIEQKCAELHPSIPPSLLVHMGAFQAAVQVAKPLSDVDWMQLKSKLLDQVDSARIKQAECINSLTNEKHYSLEEVVEHELITKTRPAGEVSPMRRCLLDIAESVLQEHPTNNLEYSTSPQFAATVLMQIRNQLEVELTHNRPDLSRPTLMDMKWLFEEKIGPLTHQFRKDIFLCAGCNTRSRPYSFEGLIQHFAAKHTTTFSAGGSVVAWQQSEWPLSPPFQLIVDGNSSALHAQSWSRSAGCYSNNTSLLSSPLSFSCTPGTSPQAWSNSSAFSGYGPWQPPPFSPVQSSAIQLPQSQPLSNRASPLDPNAPFYVPPNIESITSPVSSNAPFYVGPVRQPPKNLYQAQLAEVADIAYSSWKDLSQIKGMHPAIRIFIIISQVAARFRTRHSNKPSIELFKESLFNNQSMAPLRNINGLSCKACNGTKLYHLNSLLSHFIDRHASQFAGAAKSRRQTDDHEQTNETARQEVQLKRDWLTDMIRLPSTEEILMVERCLPSNSNQQRSMLYEAFPALFSSLDSRSVPRTREDQLELNHTKPLKPLPQQSQAYWESNDHNSQFSSVWSAAGNRHLHPDSKRHTVASDMKPVYVPETT